MPKRNITDEEYKKIAAENQDALDYKNISPESIVYEGDGWFAFRVGEKFRKLEFDGEKVEQQILVVPVAETTSELPAILQMGERDSLPFILSYLHAMFAMKRCIVKTNNYNARSIKQFHIHFIVLED